MNAQVQWDNPEKTIIRKTFDKLWEWSDLYAARIESRKLLDSVHHKVHFINDLGASPRVPGHQTDAIDGLVEDIHPNTGLCVIVTTNPLLKELFFVFSAMKGGVEIEYRFARSIEEAREIIHRLTGD
jgi:hypothetical protein